MNDRVSADDMVKLGSIVSGVVDMVTPSGLVVYVNGKSHLKGIISVEHLSDHQGMYLLYLAQFMVICTL